MKRIIPLLIILIVGAYLRLFMLSTLPPSLTWDEAAWGYNAYSLGVDGRDEFGKLLPITNIESFGDYKPPVYVYLAAPFVKVLGLNEFSVRLPSGIFGIFTIFLTYLLTKKIFSSLNNKEKEILALLSAGVLAISPWHILLSRAAFEANVATFFIIGGIYFFLLSIQRKWYLLLSVLFFVISMYTFNTARVFVPLLALVLLIKFYKHLFFKIKSQALISLILGIIIFLPLFLFIQTPQAKLRFAEVNIFSDSGIVIESNQQIENDNNAFWSKVIHNRRIGYSISYIRHYFDNLDPQFLFIKGDGNPKFSIQSVGQMYIWEIPVFILGILFLFRKREGHWWIIPVWILLGLAPAATARETPHALRIETIIPTFQILTAYGLFSLFKIIKERKSKYNIKISHILSLIIVVIVSVNFLYFIHNYLKHYSEEFSGEWQYGYKEAIMFSEEKKDKYDKIVMTEELGRPYVYALFYTRYDPRKFRKEAVVEREALGFVHVRSFGNYLFRNNVASVNNEGKKYLYIDIYENVPQNAKIVKKFYLLNGKESLVAYEK